MKRKTIEAWVCIDRKERVNYIHYSYLKPLSDTNYDVYEAKIVPIKTNKEKWESKIPKILNKVTSPKPICKER